MTKPAPRNLQSVGLAARGLHELLDHCDPPLDLGLVKLECLGEIDHVPAQEADILNLNPPVTEGNLQNFRLPPPPIMIGG